MSRYDERARWLSRNVLPHEAALRAWLLRKAPADLEIDDIVHETYARLSSAVSVTGVRNARAYAFRTAFSVIADHLRRGQIVEFHSVTMVDSEEFIADEAGPDQIVSDRDELYRLGEAIALLPAGERAVLMMRRVHGLSIEEVAMNLGLSTSGVEKRMKRALLHLADGLGRGRIRSDRPSNGRKTRKSTRHASRDQQAD